MKVKNINSGTVWTVKGDNLIASVVDIAGRYYQSCIYGPTLLPDGTVKVWGDYGAEQVFEVVRPKQRKPKLPQWMATIHNPVADRYAHDIIEADTLADAHRIAVDHLINMGIYRSVDLIEVRPLEKEDVDRPQIKGKDGTIYTLPQLPSGMVDWDKAHADRVYLYYHSKSLEDHIDYELIELIEAARKKNWEFCRNIPLTSGV